MGAPNVIRHLSQHGDVPVGRAPAAIPCRRLAGLAVAAVLALSGCRYGEMYDQPRMRPFRATSFFANSSSARPVVEGTVARLEGMGSEGGAVFRSGRGSDNAFVDSLPEEVAAKRLSDVLARGQNRFGVFCTPCHGVDGGGKGPIVLRGFPQPPKLYEDKVVKQPLGYYFDVITNGHGAMYAYGSRIPDPADRWSIASYLRALQLSQNTPADVIPSLEKADRDQLQNAVQARAEAPPVESNGRHSGEAVK
jgi:mono/diheme cytochrome c family protein